LLLDRAEEDEHAPDKRPEPEPDRLWMAYEAARSAAAKHLRVTEPQVHQRILALAEVREDPDMPDDDVRKLIGVAEAMLITDPSPTPSTPKAEPAAKTKAPKASKAKPEPTEQPAEPTAIVASRAAFQNAYKTYQEECREQGETPKPWKEIASAATGKPWPDRPGTDEYLKAAHACEQAIEHMRGVA
jgi:hypothetical protein